MSGVKLDKKMRGRAQTIQSTDEAATQDRMSSPGPASQPNIDELMLVTAVMFTPGQRQELAEMILEGR